MRCTRCINGSVMAGQCINCGYEPGQVMASGKRCFACLELMDPESRYALCFECRPQGLNLRQRQDAYK